jgi:hypothetical protein
MGVLCPIEGGVIVVLVERIGGFFHGVLFKHLVDASGSVGRKWLDAVRNVVGFSYILIGLNHPIGHGFVGIPLDACECLGSLDQFLNEGMVRILVMGRVSVPYLGRVGLDDTGFFFLGQIKKDGVGGSFLVLEEGKFFFEFAWPQGLGDATGEIEGRDRLFSSFEHGRQIQLVVDGLGNVDTEQVVATERKGVVDITATLWIDGKYMFLQKILTFH